LTDVDGVVTEDQLVQANAVFAAGGPIARLVGAPLGGIAIATGGLDTVVAVDAATFLTIAFAMLFLRAPTDPIPKPVTDDPHEVDESGVLAGWRMIRTRPVLVGYLVAQSLAQLAFAMFPLVFNKFVIVKLHGGGTEIGVVAGALVDHVNIVALFNGQTTVLFLAGIATLFLVVRRLDESKI